jgi:hypothetical protein
MYVTGESPRQPKPAERHARLSCHSSSRAPEPLPADDDRDVRRGGYQLSRFGRPGGSVTVVNELDAGPLFRFADWPNEQVPRRAAGVYTVWRGEDFIYVGMSGRGAQREDLVAVPSRQGATKGLWTRLNSHASGRRSGDQFNVYICDRFIVPVLTPGQQRDIGAGSLLLDHLTKDFIRENFSYRFVIHDDGAQALAVEQAVRAGSLSAGRPYLNPA